MNEASQLAVAPASRRVRNAADKREAILEGARRVFMDAGYGGASMDAIADAAGVSKMTLYRYFDSKEALFAGLIEGLCARILKVDPDVPLEGLPPEQALKRFGVQLLETVYAADTLALHRIVLAEVNRFPKLGELFYRSGPERNISALARYFESRDEAAFADPRKAAEAFFELVRGYTHLRLLLGVEQPPDASGIEKRVDSAIARFLAVPA